MAGRQHFIHLFYGNPKSPLINPSTQLFYTPIKRYGQDRKGSDRRHVMEERAPSIAEEFQRVAEEKARAAHQRVASKESEEAAIGISKGKYKENQIGIDNSKRGH